MHPEAPLIVAANRDEFHGRPAAAAAFWGEAPAILAGRDLEARGTWMGVSRSGRFAAVTNYRGAREPRAAESRGALPVRFLDGTLPPGDCLRKVEGESYSGFNLLVADDRELWWMSNRNGAARNLAPGIYGLGNLLLDDPEVAGAKAAFAEVVRGAPAAESLFALLKERRILGEQYGTRCSTVLVRGARSLRYAERPYAPDGKEGATRQFEFALA